MLIVPTENLLASNFHWRKKAFLLPKWVFKIRTQFKERLNDREDTLLLQEHFPVLTKAEWNNPKHLEEMGQNYDNLVISYW